MFGLGRKAKIRKAVDRARATVRADTDLADLAPIEELPAEWHAQAFGWLAVALFDDELYTAARASLDRALALAPDEPELHRLAGEIATELGDADTAIEAQRRVVAASPRDPQQAIVLAELLIVSERAGEAIELLEGLSDLHDAAVETRLAEALFVSDRGEEALALLDDVCARYDAQLKELSAADWQALKARADEAHRLRDDVYAEMHGREATIELAAAEGKLDANAGVNFRLLGARLAVKSERIAEVLELEDPDATERRGQAMIERTPASAHGLVLVGSAQLRRGEVAAARKSFERACEADGRCFAAFIGLGAAMD
ncbi:MAG TPA: tetratricopeptide repeat protein, partial [Kofleriaceae bacterium]